MRGLKSGVPTWPHKQTPSSRDVKETSLTQCIATHTYASPPRPDLLIPSTHV